MDASTRVALAGVVVSLLIGLATWWLQRRAAKAALDLGLIDQLQEERTQYRERARESDADLDSCRDKLNEALDRIDILLELGREQARKIHELQSQLDERSP